MMPVAQPLIAELEAALARAPSSWRSTTLRRLTDLFMVDAGSFSDDQIAVFDDVISRLLDNTDRRALADLSKRLAELVTSLDNDKELAAVIAKHPDLPAELRPWIDMTLGS